MLPGQYYDAETGLNYNYFRYYDPQTGRYITSDLIGLEGGLNTYTYALNNPLYWIDPDGLRFIGRPGVARGGKGVGQGGRVGIFGCIGGCLTYVQGDSETQASLQANIGGGFMVCSGPKAKNNASSSKNDDLGTDCKNKDNSKTKSFYDPKGDNSTNFSPSYTPKGAGLGLAINDDGSVCVVIGPFVSPSIIPFTINLGGINE